MRVQSAMRGIGLLWVLAGCVQLEQDKAATGKSSVASAPSLASAAPAPSLEVIAPAEAPVIVKDVRPPLEDTERLLSYFERLKKLPGAELAKEHEAARLAHGRATSDFNRISYAMTLSLPGTPFNDDARALELLNPLVKKNENGLRPLAVLLATFIQERRRMGGDLAAVQQKLDALKSLERTLIERDQNNQGRK
jgi:hypothetical protein